MFLAANPWFLSIKLVQRWPLWSAFLRKVGQDDDAQGEENQPGRDGGQDVGQRAALRHQQDLKLIG